MNWTTILTWLEQAVGPAVAQLLLQLLQQQHNAGHAQLRALMASPNLDLSGLKNIVIGILQAEGPAFLQLLIGLLSGASTTGTA
jgi:hypothetical protein